MGIVQPVQGLKRPRSPRAGLQPRRLSAAPSPLPWVFGLLVHSVDFRLASLQVQRQVHTQEPREEELRQDVEFCLGRTLLEVPGKKVLGGDVGMGGWAYELELKSSQVERGSDS